MESGSKLKRINRSRLIYGIAIVIVILLGLGSRRYADMLPWIIAEYAGDILWALTVFLCVVFISKRLSTFKAGIIAALFSAAIELSQLYHAPWIDTIRRTTIGALILGFGFLWSDLICYIIGILIGVLLDLFLNRPWRKETHG